MRIIIAGGTGFIGSELIQHWRDSSHEITVLGRDQIKIAKQFGARVTALDWMQFSKNPTTFLANADVVINLCGDNAASTRWTDARKQSMRDARILPTEQLAKALAELGRDAPHLYNASGVSIYGLQNGHSSAFQPIFTEESKIAPVDTAFMPRLAYDWEQATHVAQNANVRVTLMRFAMILAKDGGALPRIAYPFYFGLGGRIGSGYQPLSWVSMKDVCLIFDFLLKRSDLCGPINVVGVQTVQQIEFAKTLAFVLHRPAIMPLPARIVRLIFGQMGDEFLLHGQNTVPDRLLNAGYTFTHPTLDVCLRSIYQSQTK